MKTIAIVTGGTSGIGKAFATTLTQNFDTVDEIWIISRRADNENVRAIAQATGCTVCPIALDLSQTESYGALSERLAAEKPHVRLLLNCSGYGKFCATDAVSTEVNLNMLMLNCGGVVGVTQAVLPYLQAGDAIINVASVSAFQPVPYINVYAATKAFVLSYTRGLGCELQRRGIRVMAVCPFWTKTKFFSTAVTSEENPIVKKYTAMYEPGQIVSRAWRDLRRGKDKSEYGFIARVQALLAKLLPHRLVMRVWMRQQSLS